MFKLFSIIQVRCWFLDTDTNERLYVRPCSEQNPKWEFWFGIVSCDAPDASNLHSTLDQMVPKMISLLLQAHSR